jgi:hypothetical protein
MIQITIIMILEFYHRQTGKDQELKNLSVCEGQSGYAMNVKAKICQEGINAGVVIENGVSWEET